MASYSIEFKMSAAKEVRKIKDRETKRRLLNRIKRLSEEPRPPGCVKLTESEHYRIRVGSFRIVYQIVDEVLVVIVVRVAHQREVYR